MLPLTDELGRKTATRTSYDAAAIELRETESAGTGTLLPRQTDVALDDDGSLVQAEGGAYAARAADSFEALRMPAADDMTHEELLYAIGTRLVAFYTAACQCTVTCRMTPSKHLQRLSRRVTTHTPLPSPGISASTAASWTTPVSSKQLPHRLIASVGFAAACAALQGCMRRQLRFAGSIFCTLAFSFCSVFM
jgi:hypothetical protein